MTAWWTLVQLTKCSTVEHAAGRLVHHMTQEQIPGQPAHSKVHNSPVPGSHCCSLDVVDVQPVSSPPEVAASWGATAYESLLELQTGRTHQVGFGHTRPAPPGDTETYPCSSQLITNLPFIDWCSVWLHMSCLTSQSHRQITKDSVLRGFGVLIGHRVSCWCNIS